VPVEAAAPLFLILVGVTAVLVGRRGDFPGLVHLLGTGWRRIRAARSRTHVDR